jgi:integrase
MSRTEATTCSIPAEQAALSPDLMFDLAERAADYAVHAKADNTRRAYRADWQHFENWCSSHGLVAMPADPIGTLLAYLTAHAGLVKVTTLQRRLAAIREAHRYAGAELDTSSVAFRDVWKGIRRIHGQPAAKRSPLLTTALRRTLAALPNNLLGCRDRALLLIGFAAALRRSELAGLETRRKGSLAGWIEETEDGLTIHLARSKTDQEGDGVTIGVPYGTSLETCPVGAYRAWLQASGIQSGPVFRAIDRHGRLGEHALSGAAVALIVKRAIVAASIANGMTPAEAVGHAQRFSGHSLRSGLATSAAANDAPGHAIRRQLRHRKFDTTAGYIRTGRLFKQSAATMAGL